MLMAKPISKNRNPELRRKAYSKKAKKEVMRDAYLLEATDGETYAKLGFVGGALKRFFSCPLSALPGKVQDGIARASRRANRHGEMSNARFAALVSPDGGKIDLSGFWPDKHEQERRLQARRDNVARAIARRENVPYAQARNIATAEVMGRPQAFADWCIVEDHEDLAHAFRGELTPEQQMQAEMDKAWGERKAEVRVKAERKVRLGRRRKHQKVVDGLVADLGKIGANRENKLVELPDFQEAENIHGELILAQVDIESPPLLDIGAELGVEIEPLSRARGVAAMVDEVEEEVA